MYQASYYLQPTLGGGSVSIGDVLPYISVAIKSSFFKFNIPYGSLFLCGTLLCTSLHEITYSMHTCIRLFICNGSGYLSSPMD